MDAPQRLAAPTASSTLGFTLGASLGRWWFAIARVNLFEHVWKTVGGPAAPYFPGFPSVSVQVNLRGTSTPATLYAAATGGTTVTNPLTTDSAGRITGTSGAQVWIESGSYDLVVSGSGIPTPFTQPIELVNAADLTALGSGSAYALKANLPINVDDYSGDFVAAHAALVARGGGVLQLGAGPYSLPATGFAVNHDNISIKGLPGYQTKLVVGASSSVVNCLTIGYDTYTNAGNWRLNFSIEDIVLDCTANTGTQTTGLGVGSVIGANVQRVKVLGATYPFVLGGSSGYLPLKDAKVRDCISMHNPPGGGSAFAVVNVDECDIDDCTVYVLANNGSGSNAFDAEPNGITDSLRGLRVSGFKVYGNGLGGGISLRASSASDPGRVAGVRFTDFQQYDCTGGIGILVPGAVVSGVQKWTRHTYPDSNSPGRGVTVGSDMCGGDGCHIDIQTENMVASNVKPAIVLDGVNNCHVKATVRDTNSPPNTTFGVQELQTNPGIVSGFATGTPSTMTIPLTAGQVQAAGLGAITNHAAQNVTIPTADTFDRIDKIVVNHTTGVASVIQGPAPRFTQILPAPEDHTILTQVPVAHVYVAAGVTSITALNITDARLFVVNSNKIDMLPMSPPPRNGDLRLIGKDSRRALRIPRAPASFGTTDLAYAKSVLADAPVIYLPMLEQSGTTFADLTPYDGFAYMVGGLLLNQQIGATSRYGAKFDGSTTFGLLGRVDDLAPLGAFTLEAQILPNDVSGYYNFFQGGTSGMNFSWRVRGDGGHQEIILGNRALTSSSAVSTTTINHVAAEWDGTNLTTYLNGSADGTSAPGAITYGSDFRTSDWPVFIAGGLPGGAFPPNGVFPGFIRHFALYQPNIGATRIAAHAALM